MKNFESLTLEQKRVAVAKDALKQLITGKYVARNKVYIQQPLNKNDRKSGNSLANALKEQKRPCKVCAIGSMMASAIRFGVNTKLAKRDADTIKLGYNEFKNELTQIFSNKSLRLMELHFENESVTLSSREKNFYSNWLGGHKPDVRLFGILKNVIKNNGEFLPPNQYDGTLAQKFENEVNKVRG